MSCCFGLVKFSSTNNIYFCCFHCTSDLLIPFICTQKECKEDDSYNPIDYINSYAWAKSWVFPEVKDTDKVEIYVDYAAGICWEGIGSESAKMIKSPLDPYEEYYKTMKHGKPSWASEFEMRL